ncbi:MAG: lipid-transfer protein, partial [Caldilineaceae bacterium]|nr:lipid-transfer protein [Caldilineaceae bacterium]
MALADAGVDYTAVEQAYAGFVYGDSCSGNKTLYRVGMTGIPIFNVNSNCSTGSAALYMARQAIESGAAHCVLAFGFEQMSPGAVGQIFKDRPSPFARFDEATDELVDVDLPLALRYFGGAGLSHMRKYGTTIEDFAAIRAKASRHAAHNPLAIFRTEMSVQDVLDAPPIWPGVMTRSMACPPTCGAAAAVLMSRGLARRRGISHGIGIAAQEMVTDRPSTFEAADMMQVVGYDMTVTASRKVYERAGVGPEDIGIVELHDCFAHNELITYEGLGLCPEGGAQKYIADGDNSYGGKTVVNPSGGLLSKGHPLGATGLAQCFELVRQLRGNAGERQVENPTHALQHNLGLGGACVVTLYEKT